MTRRYPPPPPMSPKATVLFEEALDRVGRSGSWFKRNGPAIDKLGALCRKRILKGMPAEKSNKLYQAGFRKLQRLDPDDGTKKPPEDGPVARTETGKQ